MRDRHTFRVRLAPGARRVREEVPRRIESSSISKLTDQPCAEASLSVEKSREKTVAIFAACTPSGYHRGTQRRTQENGLDGPALDPDPQCANAGVSSQASRTSQNESGELGRRRYFRAPERKPDYRPWHRGNADWRRVVHRGDAEGGLGHSAVADTSLSHLKVFSCDSVF
jgi:hypothetical protein